MLKFPLLRSAVVAIAAAVASISQALVIDFEDLWTPEDLEWLNQNVEFVNYGSVLQSRGFQIQTDIDWKWMYAQLGQAQAYTGSVAMFCWDYTEFTLTNQGTETFSVAGMEFGHINFDSYYEVYVVGTKSDGSTWYNYFDVNHYGTGPDVMKYYSFSGMTDLVKLEWQFWGGGGGELFDNINVTLTPQSVPEPVSLSLMAAASAIGVRRIRKRKLSSRT